MYGDYLITTVDTPQDSLLHYSLHSVFSTLQSSPPWTLDTGQEAGSDLNTREKCDCVVPADRQMC